MKFAQNYMAMTALSPHRTGSYESRGIQAFDVPHSRSEDRVWCAYRGYVAAFANVPNFEDTYVSYRVSQKMKGIFSKIYLIATVAVLAAGCAPAPEASVSADREAGPVATLPAQADPSALEATYVIDDATVTLVNGRAEVAVAPGSATKEVTYVQGEPVSGDLDGDGDLDAAMVLIKEPGGSGTFFYLAAAVRDAQGYTGTNAVFLGDRIAQPRLTLDKGIVRAEFLDRSSEGSFDEAPTVKQSVEAKLEGMSLVVGRKGP